MILKGSHRGNAAKLATHLMNTQDNEHVSLYELRGFMSEDDLHGALKESEAARPDGTWTRTDFEWDPGNDQYICPEGHALKQFRRNYSDPDRGPTGEGTARYRALKEVCQACPSKTRCCPNADARAIYPRRA